MEDKASVLGATATTLLSAILFIVGFSTAKAQKRERVQDSEPVVRSEMVVSTEWLAKDLKTAEVVVLHVGRERSSYEGGHIPGARFIALNEITTTRNGVHNELPEVAQLQQVFERTSVGDKTRIVLYGEMLGLAAARAYFTLDYLGHGSRAALLDGGLEKWRAEGRELSTTEPETRPAPFTPHINPHLVVSFDVVRDLSWEAAHVSNPDVALIDARPMEEFTGVKPGDGVTRAGHIPGASSIYWMQNIVSRENPILRPIAELQRLYEGGGAVRGKTIVSYCRSGVQSSHSYFVAKYLGYDVMMYDGSYLEWSRDERAPVVSGSQPK